MPARNAEERLRVAREIARELCSVEYPTGRHFLQRAWDAVLPPKRALKMIEAWFTQGAAGARFCERYFPKAEVLVIGHFHRQGCWVKNGRTVINTGSFTRSRPRALGGVERRLAHPRRDRRVPGTLPPRPHARRVAVLLEPVL